jgi:hypothetical protein
MWQVSQLLAHANEIPDSVKKALVPDSPAPSTPLAQVPGQKLVK